MSISQPPYRRSVVFLTLLSSFIVLLSACSHRTTVESDLGIKDAPDWVNEGNQALKDGKSRFFRGTGSAPSMNDASLQQSTADNRARAELAQIFSSYMDVVANDYSAAASDTDETMNEQAVYRSIKNITQLNVSGAEIIARWRDERTGILYSLAEIDLNKVKRVTSAAKTMDATFKSFFDQHSESIFDRMERQR